MDYNPGEPLPESGKAKLLVAATPKSKAKGKAKGKGKGKRKAKGQGGIAIEEALTRPWGSRECFCGAARCRGWV